MEKAAGTIRLHYSRQFQSGGHTHTVDAESLLPVGASQETREQVARELEWNVEQLARQIAQRGVRSGEMARPQTSPSAVRPPAALEVPQPIPPEVQRPTTAAQSRAQSEPESETTHRPASSAASPSAAHTPVSESMPSTPSTRGEGTTISLPQFLKAINTHLKISPLEAMELLNVKTLEGLNYRETYRQLEGLIAQKNAGRANPLSRTTQSRPIVEAPRSSGQGTPPTSGTRPQSNPPTNMTIAPRTQSQPAPHAAQPAASAAAPTLKMVPPTETERAQPYKPEAGVDFAGSSKAPIPIQFGTVRDVTPRAYQFVEEEDEEYELPDDEIPDEAAADQLTGRLKLDELKGIRGNTAASAGRLKVLDNVMGSQISEEQLLKILQAAWGIGAPKKLKTDQVEALISWAKEDNFGEEVEAVLAWIAEEEQ